MNIGQFRILECYRSALSVTTANRHMGLFTFKLIKTKQKIQFLMWLVEVYRSVQLQNISIIYRKHY